MAVSSLPFTALRVITMNGHDDDAVRFEESRSFWYCQVDIDVLRDPSLSTTDKAIYAVLCSYMSVGDRSGRPSIGTLAEVSGCSKNTVRTSIKNLIARGVIERKERFYDGRQTSCVYKVIGTQSYGGSKFEGGRVQNLKGGGSKSGKAELEPIELEPKDIPPTPKGEERPEISEEKEQTSPEKAKANPLEEWFDKFWEHYPKKADKKRAKRTFMAIFSRASPKKQRDRMENLILRLTRYIADRKDEDPKYTKNPTTWLNAHDYDEPPGEDEILYKPVWKRE